MNNNCIVLADEHQIVLEGLRGLLETLFGGVVMVADQASLIQALHKIKPELAILDLSLLGHGDLHTTGELNKRFPNVKVIIISDYDEPDIVAEVMSSGVSGYVLKKCAATDLLAAVEKINKGGIFVSPLAGGKSIY
jgi:DNA-binding NarL/FixJ family response regulator